MADDAVQSGEFPVVVPRSDRNTEFTAFMRMATEPLHRMAFLLTGDAHRADELTQAALERTYRHWSQARDGDPLRYARKVLANLRIDAWRRTRREVPGDPAAWSRPARPTGAASVGRAGRDQEALRSTDGTSAVDDRDAVVRALLLLPVKQRRIVVLRHLLDLSEAEVADELGIPIGTVKSNAARGLAHLRTVLDNGGER
jgi:RNA polymerase sigma-70 factor (sigma-E family)